MEYTNKENFQNPSDASKNSPTYCKYSLIYPFINYQYHKIYYKFDDFRLFNKNFLTNLINKHDHIKKSVYTDKSYTAPNHAAKYKNNDNTLDLNVAVPFWVAIETMTFGEIKILLHYLKDSTLKNVMHDFNLYLSKRNQFLNLIDFLVCLRNNCSHGSLINRFRTPHSYKINSRLISTFNLSPVDKSAASILKLFDVLKLLSFFEDISKIKKCINKIRYRNFIHSYRLQRNLNKQLLSRMGKEDYSKWKYIFKKQNYYL